MAVAQVLSAEIVNFLAEAHVDAGFFRLMTQPRLEEILWVAPEDLATHGVTTGAVRDQRLSTATPTASSISTSGRRGSTGRTSPC
jgi:hypothetical protein